MSVRFMARGAIYITGPGAIAVRMTYPAHQDQLIGPWPLKSVDSKH